MWLRSGAQEDWQMEDALTVLEFHYLLAELRLTSVDSDASMLTGEPKESFLCAVAMNKRLLTALQAVEILPTLAATAAAIRKSTLAFEPLSNFPIRLQPFATGDV